MKIAIIGMAGVFPDAANIAEYYKNLCTSKDSIKPVSDERIKATAINPDARYAEFAAIDNIDRFDYKFFGLSLKEASLMDPNHRWLLQLTYHAIENAGYAPDTLKGSQSAVFMSAYSNEYYRLADQFDPALFSGNLLGMAAGRIAEQFQLQSGAQVIDTTCSSALVATHQACRGLIHGDYEYAFVGGIDLCVLPGELSDEKMGIESSSFRSKAFSSEADGTGFGEGGGVLILKRYDNAIADGDNIHAVILGSAINHDSGRSSGLTAPSALAQSEVLTKAWNTANVQAEDIGYIEAHGTGTKLGDPIEIEGLTAAFSKRTAKKQFCELSSVKSNIGHLNSSAGMAGIIKAVLALKSHQFFPSLHVRETNPFIDFENSPVCVTKELKEWSVSKTKERIAGVSGFGLSGTNCHLVLSEHSVVSLEKEASLQTMVIPFSAKTNDALTDTISALSDYLTKGHYALSDVAKTLSIGRNHYKKRYAICASSVDDLLRQFVSDIPETPDVPNEIIFTFSGIVEDAKNKIDQLSTEYNVFAASVKKCRSFINHPTEVTNAFIFQYSFYELLTAFGVKADKLIGVGYGNTVISVIENEMTLQEALSQMEAITVDIPEFKDKLNQFVTNVIGDEDVLFIECGSSQGVIPTSLNEMLKPNISVIASEEGPLETLSSDFIKELYLNGLDLKWDQVSSKYHGKRIELPNYVFRKDRCWIRDTYVPLQLGGEVHEENEDFHVLIKDECNPTEQRVASTWAKSLMLKEISLNDDFFELGGSSLLATQIMNELSEYYQHEFEFEDIFEFPTVREFAAFVDDVSKEKSLKTNTSDTIIPLGKEEDYELSNSQKRLWYIQQIDPDSYTYNLTNHYHIKGALDTQKLENAFVNIIQRHEVLRTNFINKKGEPRQRVSEMLSFKISEEHFLGFSVDDQQIQDRLDEFAHRPYHLENDCLVRVLLLQFSETEFILSLSMHHIVSDGWSMNILFSELYANYNKLLNNKELNELPLTIQYKDICYWQNHSEHVLKSKMYWVNKFQNKPEILNFPLDFTRPEEQTFHGNTIHFSLDGIQTSTLLEFSKTHSVTDYMVFLSAVYTLIYGYTNQSDVVVGMPIAGRNNKQLEEQIGFYVNTLAIRSTFHADQSFIDLVHTVKTSVIEASQNQTYPFDQFVSDLGFSRDPSRSPVFDFMVSQYTVLKSTEQMSIEGLAIRELVPNNTVSQFDMTFNSFVNEEGKFTVELTYNTDLFRASSMDEIANNLKMVLEQIVSGSVQSIRSICKHLSISSINRSLEKNNSVNRPEPVLQNELSKIDPPTNETEKKLAEIWAKELGLNHVGITVSFFEMGGHSLKGIRLLALIQESFGVEIRLAQFLKEPTIAALAKIIASEKNASVLMQIPKVSTKEHYVLSAGQKQLWLLEQQGETHGAYNIPGAFYLEGEINPSKLQNALDILVEKHEILRTNFVETEGEAQQIIHGSDPFKIELLHPEINHTEKMLRQFVENDVHTSFQLESEPLLRVALLHLNAKKSLLYFNMHHIISDGWSMQVLANELFEIYNSEDYQWEPLRIQYKDFAEWQLETLTSSEGSTLKAFWDNQFSTPVPQLDLLTDFPRKHEKSYKGATETFLLDAETHQNVQVLANITENSLFTTVYTLVNTLLYTITNTEDMVLGTPSSGRIQSELQHQIGYYVNTLPIRTRVSKEQSFYTFISEVKEVLYQAYQHEMYPMDRLVTAALEPGHSSLFRVMVAYDRVEPFTKSLGNASITPYEFKHAISKYDLSFGFQETDDAFYLNIEYCSELYKASRINNYYESFCELVRALVADPDIRMEDLKDKMVPEPQSTGLDLDFNF